jgi:beta-lactam-binding protein with PASTA domain
MVVEFLVGREMARRFVDDRRANQLAFIPALMGLTGATLATVLLVAQSEAVVQTTTPPKIKIPDVTGKPALDAARVLVDAGLRFAEKQVTDAKVPSGSVIRTEPPAKSRVDPRTQVTIVVSTGPPADKPR